jgi:hypothetical protein
VALSLVGEHLGMFGERHRRGYRGLASGLLSVGALGAILALTVDVDLPSTGHAAVPAASSARCGPATAATIAAVDDSVARRIYAGELTGTEVSADITHVKGSAELLTALESSDQPAVYAAVHRIVYTPLWHIVRLRVVQHGRVLADVGGPDIIAPVSGALRLRGRTVGSFVMSVQDDLGYVKLVSRFIGVPIDLYGAPRPPGSFVMGTLKPPPASVSDGESLTIGGQSDYRAVVLSAAAFPTGSLKVALFVPTPPSTMAARGCASVRAAAWSDVAHHVAARFAPLSARYGYFRDTLQFLSGGQVFVRSGSVRLAGAGPARVPRQGTVKYHGRTWAVVSWEATPPARIYFLTPTVPGS